MNNPLANRRALVVIAAVLSLAAFFGSAAAASFAAPYRADSLSRLDDASFHVLIPAALPPGARLIMTDLQHNADGSSDVNVFYQLPDGTRLHLWESDRDAAAMSTKNPLSVPGTTVRGNGAEWLQHAGLSGRLTELDARIGSVLVSADAPMPVSQLIAVVDSLH